MQAIATVAALLGVAVTLNVSAFAGPGPQSPVQPRKVSEPKKAAVTIALGGTAIESKQANTQSESKLVQQLGTHAPLPVEVIGFGLPLCVRRLTTLGCEPVLRHAADGSPYRTDEGNLILDCRFSAIPDPLPISVAIKAIPGVVEHGLFIGMATIVLTAGAQGVAVMVRPDA